MGRTAKKTGAQERLLQVVADHDSRLGNSEDFGATREIWGPRSDDPEGDGSNVGVRVRIGELSDGSYGIERYTSAGVRQTPTWS
jgi:hypothetical protein